MAEKTGRSDKCPCGSGKKYKKCCYDKDLRASFEAENAEFEQHMTGTPLDEYFEIMRVVIMYSEVVRRDREDGAELEAAAKQFNDQYRPGEDGWIPESFFNNWMLFDFRFGKSGKTVCERFMEKEGTKLIDPGPENLRIISGSYFTYYSVVSITDQKITLEDLFTHRKWEMNRLEDSFEERAVVGEILYTRLVGVPQSCYNVSTPYEFEPSGHENFIKGVNGQIDVYMKIHGLDGIPDENIYIESCKDALPFWAHYMLLASGTIKNQERH